MYALTHIHLISFLILKELTQWVSSTNFFTRIDFVFAKNGTKKDAKKNEENFLGQLWNAAMETKRGTETSKETFSLIFYCGREEKYQASPFKKKILKSSRISLMNERLRNE